MPELFILPIGQADHTFLYAFMGYRILGGIGVGLASMLSPLYIAEIAPAHLRGRLVSWNQFAIVFGILAVYFVNYRIALGGGDTWLHEVGWRWMFASEIIPATMFILLLLFIPETPRYYALKGNFEKAHKVLASINGSDRAKEILKEVKLTLAQPGEKAKVFSFGKKVVFIGLLLGIFQQFMGINVVMYYAPAIFKNMGTQTDASMLSTIYVGAVNVVFTVLAIITVDRFGRKFVMIPGALIMAVAMISLGFTFFLSFEENQFSSQGAAKAALIFILIYIAGFAMSWGPVTWVLLSEIFPNQIRGRLMALATATMWISNLIISWSFPILNNSQFLVGKFHHGATYWLYGIIGILAAIFISRYVPETKQKTLEEIQDYWKK
jgi:MFS transporter, SP family, xylose:H+ symportor